MHTRRLAAFLLGVWLGGILLAMVFSQRTSAVPGELLRSPALRVRELTRLAGERNMRSLLEHAAAEQRRDQLRTWGLLQLIAGAALLVHLLFGTREGWLPVVLAGGMLAIAAADHLVITPDQIGYGRAADFLDPGRSSNDPLQAAALERIHLWAEFLKLALGTCLLARLLYRRKAGRRNPSRAKVDAVDHANHSHVDR
jgi:hypothetical protein